MKLNTIRKVEHKENIVRKISKKYTLHNKDLEDVCDYFNAHKHKNK